MTTVEKVKSTIERTKWMIEDSEQEVVAAKQDVVSNLTNLANGSTDAMFVVQAASRLDEALKRRHTLASELKMLEAMLED